MQQCDDEVMSFQIESLREETLPFIHEDVLNTLLLHFPDISQLHRLLQLPCVKDWAGWILGLRVFRSRFQNLKKGFQSPISNFEKGFQSPIFKIVLPK